MDLFYKDSIGIKVYEEVKHSFEAWHWHNSRFIYGLFSGYIVRNYYNELISMAKANEAILRDMTFYIQIVYDTPPSDWKLKNENMIILTAEKIKMHECKLTIIEEIFSIISNSKV